MSINVPLLFAFRATHPSLIMLMYLSIAPYLTLSLSPLCITMALTQGQKYPLLDGR